MTPGDWFMVLSSLIYLAGAISYGVGGNWPYALMLSCYALANVGIILGAHR